MNLLILTYWSLSDALVQTYTLPYVKLIQNQLPKNSTVTLFTLEQNEIDSETKANKTVELAKQEIQWISFNYTKFGILALLKFSWLIPYLLINVFTRKINIIHSWCTPAGAIGYLLSIFSNTPLVLDSFEPHAISMVENGTWTKNSLAFKLLFYLEKKQTQRAKYIIGLTSKTPEYAYKSYGIDITRKHFVKPACVEIENKKNDFDVSSLKETLGIQHQTVCIYAGKLGGIYLYEEVFKFIKAAELHYSEGFSFIMLNTTPKNEVDFFSQKYDIRKSTIIQRFVPHHEVEHYMQLAHFALNPVKPVPSKRYCTSIKDGEYWQKGLPIFITPNISDDSEIIINNNIGVIIAQFDSEHLKECFNQMDCILQQNRDELQSKIRGIAEKYRSFALAEKVYKEIYGN